MKVLYYCKRFYMNQDLISDQYGRVYAHCNELSKLGNTVRGFCLAYYPSKSEEIIESTTLSWSSYYLGRLFWRLPLAMIKALKQAKKSQADVIIGGSDHIHIIIAYLTSRLLGKPLHIDLYDNFEAFGIGKIPGLNMLLRFCLKKAILITCVSPALSEKIKSMNLAEHTAVHTLLSTVDRSQFKPYDKLKCRTEFNLPRDAILIGCAGNLRKMMGIECVYSAFSRLNQAVLNLHFVLAGPQDPNCPVPEFDNMHYLGMLPHEKIPRLLSCLDVGIIYQSSSGYGQFAFPQKALEVAACKIPIVAANIGSIPLIFTDLHPYLYECGSAQSLADCVIRQIQDRTVTKIVFDDWQSQTQRLNKLLTSLAEHRPS